MSNTDCITLHDEAAEREAGCFGLVSGKSRYGYDAFLQKHGFEQYDTDQDAWYFGVWVNLATRQVFTYAEGDRVLETFATTKAFAAELQRMAKLYGATPPFAVTIDTDSGEFTALTAPRPGDDLIHEPALPAAA